MPRPDCSSSAASEGRIDGGPGAEPGSALAAWLVTDQRAELISALRRLAAAHALTPAVGAYRAGGLAITPHPVVRTSHPTCGYLIEADGTRAAWAPEFLAFLAWAVGSDLTFAEAAGWHVPSVSPGAPTGTHQRSRWPNKPPAMEGAPWYSPMSAVPPSRRWTPGRFPRSGRSESKAAGTRPAAV